MIAIGHRVLKDPVEIEGLVANTVAAFSPSLPSLLVAVDDGLWLTFLQRTETKLPRHILKRRKPQLVVVEDAPLEAGKGSPGPSSWRCANSLQRYQPVACLIHAIACKTQHYLGAVTLAKQAGPVLVIECSAERAADWEWLVKPWCRTVAVLRTEAAAFQAVSERY